SLRVICAQPAAGLAKVYSTPRKAETGSAAELRSGSFRTEAIAWLERMAAQELGGRHASLAGRLHLEDFDDALVLGPDFARRHQQRSRKTLIDHQRTRRDILRVSPRKLRRPMNDDSHGGMPLPMQERVCRRPRLHRTDLVTHLLSLPAPVDQAVLFGQLGG